jgi:hypothetical protein
MAAIQRYARNCSALMPSAAANFSRVALRQARVIR